MLTDLISSKTRIKIILKFFLNTKTTSYLRGLAEEFDESTNAVRVELNRLEKAGMLTSHPLGNKKIYQANHAHPLFNEIHGIVRKHLGIDQIVLNVIERLGRLEKAYLIGPFANGKDSDIIDVLLVGDIEVKYLASLIAKAEYMISRRIRYINFSLDQWAKKEADTLKEHHLLIWEKNNPLV